MTAQAPTEVERDEALLASTVRNARKTPKREFRTKVLLKRFKLDMCREAHNPVNLQTVHDVKQREFAAMHKKHMTSCKKKNISHNPAWISDIEWMSKQLNKLLKRMLEAAKGVQKTHNRLFNGLTEEECDKRYESLLRIPMDKLKDFHKISETDQETKLLALIEEYGSGSKNGGFSPTMLNAPGAYHNSYALDDRREADGSKRRPQFLHELIIRIIYACIHPQQYKALFFHRTKEIVKRHNYKWRQVRTEGRFAMMRVMMVLIPYMDFKASMRAGIKQADGSYNGISRAEICKRSGLSLDSVKNAISNLEELGFLYKSKQPVEEYEKEDGTTAYKGLSVVRCISQTLIAHLGLTAKWQLVRNVADVTLLPASERDMIDDIAFAKTHPEMYSPKDLALLEANVALFSTI